jgi:arylsulfatase A-like enzyme
MIDPWHMGRLAVEETILAEVLQANGYRTGHSGKWHIAISHNAYPQPADHGFDVTFKGRGANSKMKPHRLADFATTDPDDPYQLDTDGFPKDTVTLDALSFMEDSKKQPFFLYYATWLVHYPIMTRSKPLLEKYCNKLGVDFPTDPDGWPLDGQRNPYYCAMVEMVDHYCGQLVNYLEETDDPRWPGHKLIENTYIIFSSDNGGTRGGHGETYTDNTPLAEGKGSTKEGGIRVPLIIAGPGVRQGVETRVMANGTDFYPTILSWTKVKQPKGVKLDGCDLSALLADNPADPTLVKEASGKVRKAMVHHFPHGGGGRSSLRTEEYKLIYTYDHVGESTAPELELYRLFEDDGARVDIEEAKNLAPEMPEKAKAMKRQLMAVLDEMDASKPYLNPRAKEALPKADMVCTPLKMERDGNAVSVLFKENGAKVVKGFLMYTLNSGEKDEEWFRKKAAVHSDGRLSAECPEGATEYLFTLIDENNFLVSYPEK